VSAARRWTGLRFMTRSSSASEQSDASHAPAFARSASARSRRSLGGGRNRASRRSGERERAGESEGRSPSDHNVAITSISTSEFPGIPPGAAIVVRTGGSSPNRPRNTSFIAA
jgi:hypothetical protein